MPGQKNGNVQPIPGQGADSGVSYRANHSDSTYIVPRLAGVSVIIIMRPSPYIRRCCQRVRLAFPSNLALLHPRTILYPALHPRPGVSVTVVDTA